MSRVIYEFDLDNPDDKILLKVHQQAEVMSLVIWEFTHNTKKIACNLDEKQFEGFQAAMARFYFLMDEHGVSRE